MKKNNIRKGLLFAIKCCLCNNEFVYCINSGNDCRCYECKKKKSLKDVEKELKENLDIISSMFENATITSD